MSIESFLNKKVKVIYRDGECFFGKLNKPNHCFYINFTLINRAKIKKIEMV